MPVVHMAFELDIGFASSAGTKDSNEDFCGALMPEPGLGGMGKEEALTYLNGLPLSTPAIHAALEAAGIDWLKLLAAAKVVPGVGTLGRTDTLHILAQASENQLEVLEQLSAQHEHSMQMLTGA